MVERVPSDARILYFECSSWDKVRSWNRPPPATVLFTLQARVYNYSLAAMPSDSEVHVRFYFMPLTTKALPAGDSVLIGEEELSAIPPFSDSPNAPPNWVLAHHIRYEQIRTNEKWRPVDRVLGGGLGTARWRRCRRCLVTASTLFQVLSRP